MDIDQAANFLACSILFGAGITVLIAFLLLINNLCHQFWKSVNLPEFINPRAPIRFAEPHEISAEKDTAILDKEKR
jgi:hypothetical protein